MDALNQTYAIHTRSRYVCATCWGELELVPTDVSHLFRVECIRCGSGTTGYVTKAFANRRRDESAGELVNTSRMLRKLGIIENPNAGKTAKQLLTEMGF